jgi:hypothetical protein
MISWFKSLFKKTPEPKIEVLELLLQREPSYRGATIGKLYINGLFECYTLEDVVREVKGKPVKDWKIYGSTAIPSGIYDVEVNMSPRFKRRMPLLLNVEGFSGVRIHAGNDIDDTEGCILVGGAVNKTTIVGGTSRASYTSLLTKLEEAQAKGIDITIEIRNG